MKLHPDSNIDLKIKGEQYSAAAFSILVKYLESFQIS
jgi:hypothetical protein